MFDDGTNQESSSGEPKEHQKAPSDPRPPSPPAAAEAWQKDTQSTPRATALPWHTFIHLFIYSFRTAHGALHCFLVLPQLTTISFQKAGKEPIQKIMGCSIQTHDLYFCKPQSFHVQISIVCSKIPLSSSNLSIKNTFSHF